MNVKNFQDYINKTILDRGYDYYQEGNIIETYKQEDNVYIFQVQGSEDYEVVVNIDEQGEITYSECNCPYDFGPICKHEVASYEEQRELAKEILFDGDFEYYTELKELVSGDKTVFYNSLKEELKKDKGWRVRDMYLRLIVEENDLDEIMEFVRENPRNIVDKNM